MIFPSCSSRVEKRSRNDGPKCFFIAVTMVHVMLSFLGGWGAWEEELCGDFLSRYGKEGMKKRALYMGNCGRLCGGSCRLVHWGGKAMKGQRVIQWGWSDMKACWRTKMKA